MGETWVGPERRGEDGRGWREGERHWGNGGNSEVIGA